MKTTILIALSWLSLTPVFSQQIGFCMDDFLAERWKQDSSVFVATIKERGEEVAVKIANSDVSLQIGQGKQLIDAGVKVLVVVATDGYKMKELLEYAKDKGVKVIAYDRLIYGADLDYYVSFDNVKVGELQADYITKLKPNGNYVLINGPTFDPNANMFLEGQMKVLQDYVDAKKINIVFSKQMHEWTSMEAFMETSNFLSAYHDSIDAVIVANDGMAEGVIDALEMYGYPSVPVTGQDAEVKACQRILSNKQIITIYKPIDNLAKSAANLAVNLLKKESVAYEFGTINNDFKDVKYLKLEPTLVHKENLEKVMIKSGALKESDLKTE